MHLFAKLADGMRAPRSVAWLFAMVLAATLGSGPAVAERKVALVIGNAAYLHTQALPNPKNDAEAMAAMLQKIGFAAEDVTLKLNLDYKSMRDEIRAFATRASGAHTALVYYAGHGIEVGGVNYLVPADAKLQRDLDLEYEAITLASVLAVVGEAKKLKLVILDACRNNPLGNKIKLRAHVTRQLTRGLQAIEPPGELMVAYAAKAGTVALDGDGKHSPFAQALFKHMPTPGLDVFRMLGRVKETVLEATNGQQEPHVYGSPGGESIALVPAPPKVEPELVLPDLPPSPSSSGSKKSDTLAEEAVVRICRDVAGMTSLSVLGVMAEQYKGTPAGRCIVARIDELSKAGAGKTVALHDPSKSSDATSKTLAPPPKLPDPSLKTPDTGPKMPELPPSDTEVLSNKVADTPPPSHDPKGKGHETMKGYDPKQPVITSPPISPKTPEGTSSPTPTIAAPVTECDRIAASPDSSALPGVKAVSFNQIDSPRAIIACQNAVAQHPSDVRLQGLLGRALHKAGRFDEARHWYEKAAEKGDRVSLNNLGAMYESGQGVRADLGLARSYYERAVNAGNSFSMRNIGRLYEYGLGAPVDYALARSWYEKAAQKGEPAGMSEIGRLYQEGKGVPQDFGIARTWYEKAAAKGYAPAMSALGWLYETGGGVPQSPSIARTWYEKGAEGADPASAYNLARHLARGLGGSRDPRAAARRLLAAARLGHDAARGDLSGDMRQWDDEVRRALLELLTASGDYRGSVSEWWDAAARAAAQAYYSRS